MVVMTSDRAAEVTVSCTSLALVSVHEFESSARPESGHEHHNFAACLLPAIGSRPASGFLRCGILWKLSVVKVMWYSLFWLRLLGSSKLPKDGDGHEKPSQEPNAQSDDQALVHPIDKVPASIARTSLEAPADRGRRTTLTLYEGWHPDLCTGEPCSPVRACRWARVPAQVAGKISIRQHGAAPAAAACSVRGAHAKQGAAGGGGTCAPFDCQHDEARQTDRQIDR
eukprot:scaffold179_cov368-Prasinococcus_capsulatus_cf.AAC.20